MVALTIAMPSIAIAQSRPANTPAPNAYAAPQTVVAPPPAPMQLTRPVVYFPDRPSAELQLRGVAFVNGAPTHGWFPVCVGPCVRYVPAPSFYRVAGRGIDGSRLFEIAPGPTPLYLRAKTGSTSSATLGWFATAAGGAALSGGLFMAFIAEICRDNIHCGNSPPPLGPPLAVAGVGAIVLVIGLATVLRNQTKVSGDEPPMRAR